MAKAIVCGQCMQDISFDSNGLKFWLSSTHTLGPNSELFHYSELDSFLKCLLSFIQEKS